MEWSDTLLDTGGKKILMMQWQTMWPNCVSCSYVETRTCQECTWIFLTEEICKQSVKGMASFLLAAHSKMQEKTKRLKEELLRKMEPAPDDLRFQPLLIAKRAKKQEIHVKKACSQEKANGIAGKLYVYSALEGSNGQWFLVTQKAL